MIDCWDTSTNYEVARAIFRRCVKLEPKLKLHEDTEIVSHNVGLRPARRGGARVEIERVALPLQDEMVPGTAPRPSRMLKVIHAYGFG